jgi:hypothetical protein
LNLKIIDKEFSICKLNDLTSINYKDELYFIGKTDEEISLVCSSECVPEVYMECDAGWKAFRIEGILDFSLIGIIAKISDVLAKHKIGIFVVSTFNTDYVLIKKENWDSAVNALLEANYSFE